MSDPWRNAGAALTLLAEVNTRWPGRDKRSDGGVGDAAHATRASDHNPWIKKAPPVGMGIVRARDIDVDGVDMAWLMEHLRHLGAARDPRLVGGGYLIFNRRITTTNFVGWRVYNGPNPHTLHGHVSLTRDPGAFDSTAPWGITGGGISTGIFSGRPTIRRGATGEHVRVLQRVVGVRVDGDFGPATETAVRRWQKAKGLTADGVVGPATWRAMP